MLHKKYEGPNFYRRHPLYTQNKAHNCFLMTGLKFRLWDLQISSSHT